MYQSLPNCLLFYWDYSVWKEVTLLAKHVHVQQNRMITTTSKTCLKAYFLGVHPEVMK